MGGNPKVAIFVPPELRLGSEAPWRPTTSSIVALPEGFLEEAVQRLVGSLLTTHGRHQIRPVSFPEPCSLRRQNHQAQSSGCQNVGLKP